MKRFVEGQDRGQSTLLPECLKDWIDQNNPVRVIDVFVDGLDLADLGSLCLTATLMEAAPGARSSTADSLFSP